MNWFHISRIVLNFDIPWKCWNHSTELYKVSLVYFLDPWPPYRLRLGDRNDKNEDIVRQISMNLPKILHPPAYIAALFGLYCA